MLSFICESSFNLGGTLLPQLTAITDSKTTRNNPSAPFKVCKSVMNTKSSVQEHYTEIINKAGGWLFFSAPSQMNILLINDSKVKRKMINPSIHASLPKSEPPSEGFQTLKETNLYKLATTSFPLVHSSNRATAIYEQPQTFLDSIANLP